MEPPPGMVIACPTDQAVGSRITMTAVSAIRDHQRRGQCGAQLRRGRGLAELWPWLGSSGPRAGESAVAGVSCESAVAGVTCESAVAGVSCELDVLGLSTAFHPNRQSCALARWRPGDRSTQAT
jgi:hypothetical protein